MKNLGYGKGSGAWRASTETILVIMMFAFAHAGGQTYDAWVEANQLPAEMAGITNTPAGDGIANLFKFALGLDPKVPGPKTLFQPRPIEREGQVYATVEFTQAKGRHGLRFGLSHSTNLHDWEASPVLMERVSEPDATHERVRLVECNPLNGAVPRFLRLCADVGSRQVQLLTAPAVHVLATNLPLAGGRITIEDKASPLYGMALTIPPGAYTNETHFTIQYLPITQHHGSSLFNPITPLIQIENGGQYSQELMVLELPVEIPTNYFAMAFIYDPANGRLEALPLLELQAHSLKVATRHFSSVLVSMTPLGELPTVVDSGFCPGVDDWEFSNYGSFASPDGFCSGASFSAMWYYCEKRLGGAAPLHGRYDNRPYSFKTPQVEGYYGGDSTLGIKLASQLQEDSDVHRFAYQMSMNMNLKDINTYRAFLYAMALNQEPQYVCIWNKTGGHTMVAYRVENGVISIADPNYPGATNCTITFNATTGKIDPYYSGANAHSLGTPYPIIQFHAKSTLNDWNATGTRWRDFLIGTIGSSIFPVFRITVEEPTEEATNRDIAVLRSDQPVESRIHVLTNQVHFRVEQLFGPAAANIKFLVLNSMGRFLTSTGMVYLNYGLNKIGLELVAQPAGASALTWSGFAWVFLNRVNTNAGPVITSMSATFDHLRYPSNHLHVVKAAKGLPPYTFTWSCEGVLLEEHTVEHGVEDRLGLPYSFICSHWLDGWGCFIGVQVCDSQGSFAAYDWGGDMQTMFYYNWHANDGMGYTTIPESFPYH
jgi:hypothetical protein